MNSIQPAKFVIEFILTNQIISIDFSKIETYNQIFELLSWDVNQSISSFDQEGVNFNLFQYLGMLMVKHISIPTVHVIA